MTKLIKFIKKLHWKVYGKKHLLNKLHEGMKQCTRAWFLNGMKTGSYLDHKLTEYIKAIHDVEGW